MDAPDRFSKHYSDDPPAVRIFRVVYRENPSAVPQHIRVVRDPGSDLRDHRIILQLEQALRSPFDPESR